MATLRIKQKNKKIWNVIKKQYNESDYDYYAIDVLDEHLIFDTPTIQGLNKIIVFKINKLTKQLELEFMGTNDSILGCFYKKNKTVKDKELKYQISESIKNYFNVLYEDIKFEV